MARLSHIIAICQHAKQGRIAVYIYIYIGRPVQTISVSPRGWPTDLLPSGGIYIYILNIPTIRDDTYLYKYMFDRLI